MDEQDKALFPDETAVDSATGGQSLALRLEATIDQNGTLDIRRTGPSDGASRQLSRDQLAGLGWKMIDATAASRDIRNDRGTDVGDILRPIDLADEQAGFDVLITQLAKHLAGERDPDTLTEVAWSALHGVATLTRAHRLRPDYHQARLTMLADQLAGVPG